MISAEQLRQYLYCPRKIYWRDMAKIPRPPTFLMRRGDKFHKAKVVRNYKFTGSIRTYREYYMESEELGLKGVADTVVEYQESVAAIEYKENLPHPIPRGYKIQLLAIGMLAEEHFSKPISGLFLTTQQGKTHRFTLSINLRNQVRHIISKIEHLIKNAEFPDTSTKASHCRPCEYSKICSYEI